MLNNNNLDTEIKEALKNWKEIISSYQVPNDKKAIFQLLNTFLPFLGLWVLMYFSLQYSVLLAIGLGLVNAFFMVRIFIIQHDCGHQSFFKSKKLNNIVGYICSLFSSIPYKYWARVHNFHHGHNGQLEVREVGDIPTLTVAEYRQKSKWGKLGYRIWRNPIITFIIAPAFYFIVSNRIPMFKDKLKNMKSLSKSQLKNNLIILVLYAGLAWLIGWKQFLFIQLTLIFLFGIIAFWFFYIQHQHESSYKQWKDNWDYLLSAIRGSSYYKLPRVFQWLTGNIGIHHIHHLSSLIPNYNLEKCMRENKILNKYVTTIGFWESLKMMKYKLWDEERCKMVSFDEYYKYEKARKEAA